MKLDTLATLSASALAALLIAAANGSAAPAAGHPGHPAHHAAMPGSGTHGVSHAAHASHGSHGSHVHAPAEAHAHGHPHQHDGADGHAHHREAGAGGHAHHHSDHAHGEGQGRDIAHEIAHELAYALRHGHGLWKAADSLATHPTPRAGITAERVVTTERLIARGYEKESVVYAAVAKYPAIVDGIYCYCHCAPRSQHYSLLTCFESGHSANCFTCMGSGELATKMASEGKSLEEIRAAVDQRFARRAPIAH